MSSLVAVATPIASGVLAKMGAHPLLTALGGVIFLLVALVIYITWENATISYANLPGPPTESFLWGNLREVFESMPSLAQRRWMNEYGDTVRYSMLLSKPRLCTRDITAMSFMLQHDSDFPKPYFLQNILGKTTAPLGLLVTEGAVHHRQRRVLNPAFGPASVKGMDPIFFDKAYELRDKLVSILHGESNDVPSPTPPAPGDEAKGGRKMDISKYLAQTTLDVIGLAGFDYDFHALAQTHNDLAEAIFHLFSEGQALTKLNILYNFFPWIAYFYVSPARRTILDATEKLKQYGIEFVQRKRRQIQAEYSGQVEKGSIVGRDLLTLLMKANMSSDLRPDQKLTDAEVVAQIVTFILAGNETSSTALTWLLYRLSQNPDIQKKLRDELLSVPDDRPDQDAMNALPYLDKVVREILRFDGPVPGTERCAARDIVIPLGQPVRGRDGTLIDTITVPRGTEISFGIMEVNHSKDIWGDDADRFNPDRYDRAGLPMKSVPGVYGNLLTFLGGPHNCIGYRFALAEIKAVLFVLVRNFTFDILPSAPVIEPKTTIVMRPRVVGEEEAGLQMPLLVREYIDD